MGKAWVGVVLVVRSQRMIYRPETSTLRAGELRKQPTPIEGEEYPE